MGWSDAWQGPLQRRDGVGVRGGALLRGLHCWVNAEGERVVAVLASPKVQESLDRHAVLPGTMTSD